MRRTDAIRKAPGKALGDLGDRHLNPRNAKGWGKREKSLLEPARVVSWKLSNRQVARGGGKRKKTPFSSAPSAIYKDFSLKEREEKAAPSENRSLRFESGER